MSLKVKLGALVYDWPRFLAARDWVRMRNRRERLSLDGRGARCEWEYTSDLHIATVFPSAGARLMRRAFRDWPVVLRDAPPPATAPRVSFVIGHRGVNRLPHLLATLRSIAGQEDAAVECIVVEQSPSREIENALPSWVRYIHQPVAGDYNRSATLNEGARQARGEVLVLHDNDMICPARYASEVLARAGEGWEFQQLKRFTFYLGEADTKRVFETGMIRTDLPSTVVQNLHGASIAASRDAYFAVGGFDESFVGWGGEDNEFWDRAATTGRVYAFGYLPFLHLWHAPQPGKLRGNDAPAVRRWHELKHVPAEERIRRLRGQA